MIEVSTQNRHILSQIAAKAARWIKSQNGIGTMLGMLLDEETGEDFTRTTAELEPSLARWFMAFGLFEIIQQAERTGDPEDLIYLSINERCDLEALMGMLEEIKKVGVADDQAERIDAAIGAIANLIRL